MASSLQLMSNDYLIPLSDTNDVALSDHTVRAIIEMEAWEGYKWTMLCALVILFMLFCFGRPISFCVSKCCPKLSIKELKLREGLDDYWDSLDAEDRKWALAEEANSRILGMPMLSDEQFKALNDSQMTQGKTLMGTHSYDILANPLYYDDF